MTIWSQNFWLIEAKKLRREREAFDHSDLKQALQYASHPDINAALIVLCDGRVIDVFDREVSLEARVLRIEVVNLSRDFDRLRALLSPWQSWFFEKRRVLRAVDKVFDREINLTRLEEFRRLIDSRLVDKRGTVLNNYQKWSKAHERADERAHYLATADNAELVNLHFFLRQSAQDGVTITDTLISRCNRNSFSILYLVFPDNLRDTNDTYWASALHFLLGLAKTTESLNWLPSFLLAGNSEPRITEAAKILISLCLSHFREDENRKCVLLYSAAARRVAKQMMVMIPGILKLGNSRHALVRHMADEMGIAQFMSSPEGHNLQQLDEIQMLATLHFCQDCRDSHDRLMAELRSNG